MNKNKFLLSIILIGFIVRLSFLLVGAELYYSKKDFYLDLDTYLWADAFINLLKTGTFTTIPGTEYGYFSRMPGYSFVIGFFYLICKQDLILTCKVIALVQTLIDTISIYIIYKISQKIFNKQQIALITSALYSLYPFIIVWNPIAYSETIGIFFMILSLFFFLHNEIKFNYAWCGVFVSLALLNRPQIALLIPIYLTALFVIHKKLFSKFIIYSFHFCLMILVFYGPWPLRNYLNYSKFVLTQDIRGIASEDKIAFLHYIHSIKSGWEPQISQLMTGKKVDFPKIAYKFPGDSVKLVKAVELVQTCGFGYIYMRDNKNIPINKTDTKYDCMQQIAEIFIELRSNHIKNNPVNYYLVVPLQNLKKAFFKTKLVYEQNIYRKFASYLFYYRTFLIIIGILGLILMGRNKLYIPLIICTGFFITLYLTLCFGTGPVLRNIEIRYFLPADLLLLFPASFTIYFLINFFIRSDSKQ